MINRSLDVESLCTAAYDGNLETLRTLLQGMTIEQKNSRNSRGQTALYCAARQGQEEIVKTLLRVKGIDVNAQDTANGSTALHAASYANHPRVVSILISFGCDINISNKILGLTAFAEARGEAREVWSIYNAGGKKALVKKGYPVVKKFSLTGMSSIINSTEESKKRDSRGNIFKQVEKSSTIQAPTMPPSDLEEVSTLSEAMNNKSIYRSAFEINDSSEDDLELSSTESGESPVSTPLNIEPPQASPLGVESEGLYWVLFEPFDPVQIQFPPSSYVADFRRFLCRHKQFQHDLGKVQTQDVNLFLRREQDIELDMKKRMGTYNIGEDLIIIKIGKC